MLKIQHWRKITRKQHEINFKGRGGRPNSFAVGPPVRRLSSCFIDFSALKIIHDVVFYDSGTLSQNNFTFVDLGAQLKLYGIRKLLIYRYPIHFLSFFFHRFCHIIIGNQKATECEIQQTDSDGQSEKNSATK